MDDKKTCHTKASTYNILSLVTKASTYNILSLVERAGPFQCSHFNLVTPIQSLQSNHCNPIISIQSLSFDAQTRKSSQPVPAPAGPCQPYTKSPPPHLSTSHPASLVYSPSHHTALSPHPPHARMGRRQRRQPLNLYNGKFCAIRRGTDTNATIAYHLDTKWYSFHTVARSLFSACLINTLYMMFMYTI